MMTTFEFSLKFSVPEDGVDKHIERLGEAGCDDALIGVGRPGRIALNFDRAADSAFAAVAGAVSEVRAAIPEARLIEVAPDLVGLTDLAGIVQCSRQYMRKLMIDGGESFPLPLHEGKTALWRLAKVLIWLRDKKHYRVDEQLLAIAEINMQFNIARETAEMDAGIQQSIHGLVA